MRKILMIAVIIVLLGGIGTLGWWLLQNQTASAPKNKVMPPASKSEESPDPSGHSSMDVDFAQKMIVHNQQAIEMTEDVLAVSTNQAVREIATDIQKEQKSAEDQYKSWLGEWGETYTNLSDFPKMDGHDMYPTYLGLASASSMTKLKVATSNEIDRLFINLMITHHDGAIQGVGISNGLQYGKLIEFKNKSFTDYKNDIKKLKDLQKDVQ